MFMRVARGYLVRSFSCALLATASLLAAKPALAFRTGRDLADLSETDRVKFAGQKISFSLQKNLPSSLNLAAVEAALTASTSAWSAPACSGAQFSYDGASAAHAAPGDGVNTIEWVSDWSARGFPADAPGATDVQYEKQDDRWAIVEADMYLNRAFTWTTDVPAASDEREVTAVVTHEAGHMLGLLHPCEAGGADGAPTCSTHFDDQYSGATMYPFYSPSESVLSQDDIDGVCFLYPRAVCPDAGCGDGQVCTVAGCAATCADRVCEVGDVCAGDACRAQSSCLFESCAGSPCLTNAGCGVFDHCDGSVCVRGDRPNGDPCQMGADCSEGGCLNGACARACGVSAVCGADETCDAASGACSSALSPLGDTCQQGSECAGGLCVSGAKSNPVCSRACGDTLPACPSGWSCDHVDGKQACAPRQTSRSSCSISFTQRDPSRELFVFVLALAGWAACGRRAQRKIAIRS